jgi:methionyl-tRNA formyltransferase
MCAKMAPMAPRTIFMGSPEFALPVLRKLAAQYSVVGVVTQPDRPAGRGRRLSPPPIKILAEELGLPIFQPRKVSQPEVLQQLEDWSPELIVVAAFGQILRPSVLDLAKYGSINVHASLLPRWRGAAPIQAAILNGDTETGITIMQMDPGIDTGPTLSQRSIQIPTGATTGTLSVLLAEIGADLLLETLPAYLSGELTPRPQEIADATYAPIINKEDGLLDFSKPAIYLERMVRAFQPWPGVFTYWHNQILKVIRARVADQQIDPVGKKIIHQALPAITTAQGILVLDELQLAGRNIQSGKAFLQGARNWADEGRS